MALTVHVDIVKRTGLAISRIFFLVTTPWLILQHKNKRKKNKNWKKEKKNKGKKINSTLPKILNKMCEM